jgi:hypothetical protein
MFYYFKLEKKVKWIFILVLKICKQADLPVEVGYLDVSI